MRQQKKYVPPTAAETQEFVDNVLRAMSTARTVRALLKKILPLRAAIIKARYSHEQHLTSEDRFYLRRCRRVLVDVV